MTSLAVPRYATEWDPSWDSALGDECVAWALDELGVELHDWQASFVRTALALTAPIDEGGRLANDVLAALSVCRQQGKSLVTKVLVAWWSVRFPGSWSVWIAQSRVLAVEHLKGLASFLHEGGIPCRFYRGVPERIEFPNGSEVHVAAPNHTNVHGATISGVCAVDEAWVSLSEELMQGIIPARTASEFSLLVALSTMGDDSETEWNALVDRGRDAEEAIAYTEYAMDPEVHDLYDPDQWDEWMPSLGKSVTRRAVERGLLGLRKASEQKRAYGNIQVTSLHELYDLGAWRELEDVTEQPAVGDLVLSLTGSPHEPRGSTVGAAWRRPSDDRYHVEIVEHRPGGGVLWLVDELQELIRAWRPRAITLGGDSAIYAVRVELEAIAKDYAIPFRRLPAGEESSACSLFAEHVRDGLVTHGQSAALDLAMQYATPKQESERGYRIDVRNMRVDGSPLTAAIAALAMAHEENQLRPDAQIFTRP